MFQANGQLPFDDAMKGHLQPAAIFHQHHAHSGGHGDVPRFDDDLLGESAILEMVVGHGTGNDRLDLASLQKTPQFADARRGSGERHRHLPRALNVQLVLILLARATICRLTGMSTLSSVS